MANERSKYEIHPTGAQRSDQYSDISMTNLVNILAGQISSERQAIWQRYTAYLIANSLIFGFVISGSRTIGEIIVGVIFGIILCIFWLIITAKGWDLHTDRRNEALNFVWMKLNNKANPFYADLRYEKKLAKGLINWIAILTIWLFIGWYIFIGILYSLK